jgi:hypothetical protein
MNVLQDAFRGVTDVAPLSPDATPRRRRDYAQKLADINQWVGQMGAHVQGLITTSLDGEQQLHHGNGEWGKPSICD